MEDGRWKEESRRRSFSLSCDEGAGEGRGGGWFISHIVPGGMHIVPSPTLSSIVMEERESACGAPERWFEIFTVPHVQ